MLLLLGLGVGVFLRLLFLLLLQVVELRPYELDMAERLVVAIHAYALPQTVLPLLGQLIDLEVGVLDGMRKLVAEDVRWHALVHGDHTIVGGQVILRLAPRIRGPRASASTATMATATTLPMILPRNLRERACFSPADARGEWALATSGSFGVRGL